MNNPSIKVINKMSPGCHNKPTLLPEVLLSHRRRAVNQEDQIRLSARSSPQSCDLFLQDLSEHFNLNERQLLSMLQVDKPSRST